MGSTALSRGLRWPIRAAAAVGVILVLLCFMPTGYYIYVPGGAAEVAPMIEVEAPGASGSKSGPLLMLYVFSPRATWFWYVYGHLGLAHANLVAAAEHFGVYGDEEQYSNAVQDMMTESQQFAAAAGFRAAGRPVTLTAQGVRVTALLTPTAAEVLRPGDVIDTAGAQPIFTAADLTAVLAHWPPGAPLPISVRRGGGPVTLEIPTLPAADRPGSYLGAAIATAYAADLPGAVKIHSGQITGPSAGLMFSLEVYRQLTGAELTRGGRIAGTGAIDPDGRVLPVGGIVQKAYAAEAAGASVLLVPAAQLAEAQKAGRHLQVVPVATVAEAISWLRQPTGGGE